MTGTQAGIGLPTKVLIRRLTTDKVWGRALPTVAVVQPLHGFAQAPEWKYMHLPDRCLLSHPVVFNRSDDLFRGITARQPGYGACAFAKETQRTPDSAHRCELNQRLQRCWAGNPEVNRKINAVGCQGLGP